MAPLAIGSSGAAHIPDGVLLAIALAATLTCFAWLAVVSWRHRRDLRAVPVRIHVAGTRGKSTTTRLIAAGLRAGRRRVIAKATGSEPRLIDCEGTERPWPRRGPASIREQIGFFALAARSGAEAAVVECMAIRPELVWASEAHLVRATTAVITNARPDHFEEVGDDPGAALDALRWSVPSGGRLVVAAEAATEALKAWAAKRGADVTVVDTAGLDPLAANRALALAVCDAHGVPRSLAAPAMDATAADPGAFFERRVCADGKTVHFHNGFACNDVDSLALLWRSVPQVGTPVVLLNARADRPLRSRRFLEFLAAQNPRPILFVAGDRLALRLARRSFGRAGAQRLRARTAREALAELAGPAVDGGALWGVGNYQGVGARLIAELSERRPAC